jgi:hypothetical protein
MRADQKRTFQAFRRVEDWLGARPAMAALVAPLQAALGTILTALSDAGINQDAHLRSSKGATAEASRLRKELVADNMRLVARAAESALPDVVKATAALQLPPKGTDDEGLYNSAGAMATAAEPHQQALVDAGMPANAISELRAVAAQFRGVVDARGQSVAERSGATKSIGVQLKKARKLVETISVIVTKALRSDPVTLAEWRQLKRVTVKGVQGSGQVKVQAPAPDVPPASTQPSASPATVAQEVAA